MENRLMPQGAAQPMSPQGGAPQGPQGAPSVDPAQIADAQAHAGAVLKILMGLAAKPKGSLSKRDVFNGAADMIADGAFATPQARQQLVAEIAQMPDDETAIRQAIGGHLMRLTHVSDLMQQHFGPGG